ncbi:MAG: membrane protein insertase YidC [Gemmatimonadetes bacterium]|nr:membrane protein insertase YidC [Gemmatimonadota bacterium]
MKALPRLLLAMALMTAVFVVTNRMFPPVLPEPAVEPTPETPAGGAPEGEEIDFGQEVDGVEETDPPSEAGLPEGLVRDEEIVTVETPLMRVVLSSRGPALRSVELIEYESLAPGGGPVQLVPQGIERLLAGTWRVGSGSDELDLTRLSHSVSPAEGLRLTGPGETATLTFRYEHPTQPFASELRYTFTSDSYIVGVEGRLPARARAAIFVDLGVGPAVNELREADDRAMMAFSASHASEGIRSRLFGRVKEPEAVTGPLSWAAVKSKYFVQVILAGGGDGGEATLAGLWAEPVLGTGRVAVRVGMPIGADGGYRYRAYLGPIDRDRLSAIRDDLKEVNPVGWAFFRPIIKPFVAVALWAMRMLHDHVGLTYGWVLIAIGVLVRVVLWPLNQKAMRSQLKNMAAAPLLEEIKQKYGKDPQKMQQETLKLYKEQGINPLAGCVPLLIPWPMLLALFFVFQNTIQLRGQSFLWLQDLSAPDPFYVLPVFMAASLFVVQRISMKSMATVNPQMKMMMYILPIFLLFIFWRFASGLNLYYAAFNVATIPQQILIARERRRAQAEGVVPGPGPKKG